jgi:hypothetical protein
VEQPAGPHREAKELNRVNGMLVNKQLAHNQGMLNALRRAGHRRRRRFVVGCPGSAKPARPPAAANF